MSTKLKALGAGLLAMLAVGAFGVMNAMAINGGHFVSEADETTIVGTESGEHQLHLVSHGLSGEIGCDKDSYHGTMDDPTETEITVTVKHEQCYTTNPEKTPVTVNMGDCDYRFTVKGSHQNENTVDLVCPTGRVTVTHPNCTITVVPQNNLNSVTYTTDEKNGVETITLDSNVEFKTQYHTGICVFLGTNHTATLEGSVTVEGFDHATLEPVDITATA